VSSVFVQFSDRTHYGPITGTNSLILHREIARVYSANHKNHKHKLFAKYRVPFSDKGGEMCSKRCALNSYENRLQSCGLDSVGPGII
jgi:hypothetical protein